MNASIEELKKWLENEHDSQLFQRDRNKMRGDFMAWLILKKMKELGLIQQYELIFQGSDGFSTRKYKIRYIDDEEVKLSCSNCDRNNPESDEIAIYCDRCANLEHWRNDAIFPPRDELEIVNRLGVD